jgi:hypothetical protein
VREWRSSPAARSIVHLEPGPTQLNIPRDFYGDIESEIPRPW